MRGDRLLKMMLLLQARGKMSVAELRKELEVSERTVYRDLVALDSAGVPIVTERGPGGGCSLVEGYTTRLTGLTEEEAGALFAAGVPGAYEALGLDKALAGALAKLAAALPSRLRDSEARSRGRIHLAPQAAEGAAVLAALRVAVLGSRRVRIERRFPFGPVADSRLEQKVEALGLVSTGRDWFLVAGFAGLARAFPISDIAEAEVLEEGFDAPAGFKLADFWEGERARRAASDSSFNARLRIAPRAAPYLRPRFGSRVEAEVSAAAQTDPEGLVEIELGFSSLEEALLILPGLGGAVQVLAPKLLRLALVDRARACLLRNEDRPEEKSRP